MSTDQSTTPRERGLIYRRVSDDKQSGGSSQLTNARQVARLYGLEVVAEIEDDGQSGDDLGRAGLAEVLATIEKAHRQGDPIGWLVVDQGDRLSRADSLETSELLLRLRRHGVRKVATPSRAYDLYDALDRTLLQIEADHKNNPYLKDLGRRVLGGMLDSARQGFWTGQKPPLGYRVVRTAGDHGGRRRTSGRLEIDPETAPVVRELFDRYAGGTSTRDLAAWVGARLGQRYSRSGLQRILQKEIYAGTRVFGGRTSGRHARLVDGTAAIMKAGAAEAEGDTVRLSFPDLAIVTAETFALVQARIATGRSRSQKKANPISPLSGLCICGGCGAPMRSSRTAGYPYLVCERRNELGVDTCPDGGYVRADIALARVLATLADRLLSGDAVATLVELAGKAEDESAAEWERRVEGARRGLEACDARLTTARRRLASAADDLLEDYQQVVRELKEERATLEADLARLRTEAPAPEEGDAELLTRWLETCRAACQEGEGADPAEQNAVLRELVAEVRLFLPPRTAPQARNLSKHARRKRVSAAPGRVEVVLPEWLSRVLATIASDGHQHAKGIVLVSEGDRP